MKDAGVLGIETFSTRRCRYSENKESNQRGFLQHFEDKKDSKEKIVTSSTLVICLANCQSNCASCPLAADKDAGLSACRDYLRASAIRVNVSAARFNTL